MILHLVRATCIAALTAMMSMWPPIPAQLAVEEVKPQGPELAERIGAGNLTTFQVGANLEPLYAALQGVGARMGRMNSYGWRTSDGEPFLADFEAAMLQAWKKQITPIVLFEYSGDYQFLPVPVPLRGYDHWFKIGAVYAERFRPNGSWARDHGISGWGVTIFSAMNEPDVLNTIPKDAYRDALAGLADGVHSVDPTLRVIPGGFGTCNMAWDPTLRGYATAITDLFNDGRLDGLDLHTYYSSRWFPITRGRRFSAQACFDAIKKAAGITRDINFYSTEFNQPIDAADETLLPREELASLFLTGLWDQLGVAGADGHRPTTILAFPWDLGSTPETGVRSFAMSVQHNPWVGDVRAEVLRMVLRIAGRMRPIRVDQEEGEVWLLGTDESLLVWHNRSGWTRHSGPRRILTVPEGVRSVEVWGYDGLRRVIPIKQSGNLLVEPLVTGETYMFLFRQH